MPTAGEKVKADTILEINNDHDISKKLKSLYETKNTDEIKKYAKILYNQARLLSGLSVDNASELTDLICEMISK